MQNRREALKFGLKAISLVLAGGFAWSTQTTAKAQTLLIRPPSALKDKNFLSECIRCGLCVEACPWDTLKLADLDDGLPYGTPFFYPAKYPLLYVYGYPVHGRLSDRRARYEAS